MNLSDHIPAVRLELRASSIHLGGVGVFAVRDIQKGSRVAEGIADEDFDSLVPWCDFDGYDDDLKRKISAFCVGTPEGFVPPPEFDFNKMSIEWYLNHSCDGNCGFDSRGDFVAIRDITKGEEICYDYALAESNPNFLMWCGCQSQSCRHKVTGTDWKNEEFFSRNRAYMHPHLRRLLPVPA